MNDENAIGYAAVTNGDSAPLFCKDCGEDANREVEPLTEDDMENFDRAKCAICGDRFYGGPPTPWRSPTVESGEGADILSARIHEHLDDGEAVLVVFDEGPRERLFVPSDARLTRIGSSLDMSAGAIGPTSIDPWRVAEVQRYDGWGYTTTRTRHRYGTPVEVRIRVAEDVGEADAGDRKVVHDSLLDALGNAYEWDENAIPDGGDA